MHHRRSIQITAVVAGAALLLAACSDDGSGTSPTAPASTAPASTAPATAAPATAAPSVTDPPTTASDPSVEVSWHYTYQPPDGFVDDLLDNFPANPPDPAAGKLGLFSAHGVMQDTGDLAGTVWFTYGSSEHPTGFVAGGIVGVALGFLSGTVAPCGTGTVAIATSAVYPPGTTGNGVWRVLEGYGTGDLATMTGSGTSTNRDGADSGEGEMTGSIVCDGASISDDAQTADGSPVAFSWAYGPADNATDPGGNAWQGTGAEPANGELGLMHGHGTFTLAGDLSGSSRRVWVSIEHPAGWLTSAGTRTDLVQFAGSVAGCGEGTAILIGTAVFGPGTATPDSLLHSDYTWEILPGFGTGALASATGSGVGATEENSTTGSATLTGNVTCTA